jgi:hypothetical protein
MTHQLPTVSPEMLATANGGMQFPADARQSTNVEDRRTPEGKARDQKWFEENRSMYSPDRPADTLPKAPNPMPDKKTFGGPR